MIAKRYQRGDVERAISVEMTDDPRALRVTVGERPTIEVRVLERDEAGCMVLAIGSRRVRAASAVIDGERVVQLAGRTFRFADASRARPVAKCGDVDAALSAPMPATVVGIHAALGAVVKAGAVLLTVEAMKMAHDLRAPFAGRVTAFHAEAGALVDAGVRLVDLEPLEDGAPEPDAPNQEIER